MKTFAGTDKQMAILSVVFRDADAGTDTPLATLSGRLPHKPGKHTLLCSMKYLIEHGFIEKEQRRIKGHRNPYTFYKPTPKAYLFFRKPLKVT